VSIDYDRIFAETLQGMVEEKLDERGIDSITEEQFDRLMDGMAVQQQICVGELRRKFGMSTIPKIRLW
jgi:hypothetical protein